MLGLIALVLVILWAISAFSLEITNALIHVLLIVGLVLGVVYLYRLVSSRIY
jgi:hypothetical protein